MHALLLLHKIIIMIIIIYTLCLQVTVEEPFLDSSSDTSESDIASSSDSTSNSSTGMSSSSSFSSVSSEDICDDDLFEPFFDDAGITIEDNHSSPPLFPGSSLNTIAALAVLFSWFSSFPGISKQAFSQLLYILHHFILPSGNLLPASYAAAHSIIQPSLVPVQEFHCCPNDCILYRGDYADATCCPECNEERYVDKKVPKKRFKYLPLLPRIARFFKSEKISQLLQSHNSDSEPSTILSMSEFDVVHDIHQTQTWKEWYDQCGIFHGDTRGLALSLCMDGTNPYSKEKNSYSMWPMFITILNLPSVLRRSAEFLQLVGVIPGKKEPKNTDAYLQVLIDELQNINGTSIYDAHQKSSFTLQAHLLLHTMDYPGQSKVFHCYGEQD